MVGALLLLQVVVLAPRPDPQDPYRLPPLEGPLIGAIEVLDDSVLYLTRPKWGTAATTTVYAFDRSARTWSRAGVSSDATRGDPFGTGLLTGWNGVRSGFPVGSDGWSLVADQRGLAISRRQTTGTIQLAQAMVRPDGDTVRFVLERPQQAGNPPAELIHTLTVVGDTAWLGLLSNKGTDMSRGRTGGLVAFDMRTGRSSTRWLPELSHNTVNVIEEADGRLWLGTDGGLGIRESDGSWTWFHGADLGLPSDAVTAMAAGGDTTWLGTRAGPGALADGRWFGPRWVPALSGDSVVMDLTDQPPEWSERDAILRLGWLLQLDGSGGDFVEAMQQLPRSTVDAWRNGTLEYTDVLMDSTLYPFMAEAYLLHSGPRWVARPSVIHYVAESEGFARDILVRANRIGSREAREVAYGVLGDYPAFVLADARALLARDSLSPDERAVVFPAIGSRGDVSDIGAIFDHAIVYNGCCINGPPSSAIAAIISRSDPRAVRDVMKGRPMPDRLIALRELASSSPAGPGARPTLAAECMIGLDAFSDPAATDGDIEQIARYLDMMGIPEALPIAMQRDWWDPMPLIERLRREPDAVRGLPLDPDAPGFDPRDWVRRWWTQVGRFRPQTNCESLGGMPPR